MLTRKNLIVDAAKVRRLSARWRTSESEAVRRAVDASLFESTVMDAVEKIRARGGITDVYGRFARSRR